MNSAPPGARWSLDARVARPSGMPAPPPSGTAGIAGMRERAMLVGGRLSIESRPNQGTEVRLTVPVDREGA